MLTEPGIADFQQRQINPGQLIADQHHPGGQHVSFDSADQELLIIP